MDFLAEVVFYTEQRKVFPQNGYRPDVIFSGSEDYWGITFIDFESNCFNTPILATIEFTFQDSHYQEIVPGQSFKIMEGSHQVGEGKVLFIEN